jgi:hypothetical protein
MTPRHLSTRRARALTALAAALLLGGCTLISGPQVPPTEFFVLNTTAPTSGGPRTLAIGLGPLSFPEYLSRPQMATRLDANRIAYSEVNRWAEPLKQNFTRALAGDLVQVTGAERIEIFPWYNTARFDYVIAVAVVRFEQQVHGEAELVAHWTLRRGDGSTIASRTTSSRRIAETPDQSAAALSELIAQLAAEIAAAIGR